MPTTDSIESALARLMPVAMSQNGQRAIEDLIDELADELPPEQQMPSAGLRRGQALWRKCTVPASLAAAAAVAIAFVPLQHLSQLPHIAAAPLADDSFPTVVLVSESDRIQSMTDEGWISDPDGATMQAVKIHAIGIEQVRDNATGILVEISEPREEILLTPVSAF